MIVAVVLAAGLSKRMGQPKLLLALDGTPVLRHAVERVLAGGLDEIVIVVPPTHDEFKAALAGMRVRFAVNPNPEAGQGTSIAAGIAALPPGTEAALVALGDQPHLPPQVIPALIDAFKDGRRAIAAPRYREGQGNPVLFGVQVFSELRALTGDRGARSIVDREPGRVTWVDLDLPMPSDVDTLEDYERLRSRDQAV